MENETMKASKPNKEKRPRNADEGFIPHQFLIEPVIRMRRLSKPVADLVRLLDSGVPIGEASKTLDISYRTAIGRWGVIKRNLEIQTQGGIHAYLHGGLPAIASHVVIQGTTYFDWV